MPPPPVQAGKFKPRKPVKKVRPGGDTTGNSGPDAAPSANLTVAFAPSTDNNRNRSQRGSSDRDDGGRGGRGGRGRGRGRAPIPSGRVFFTGGEKPAASSAKRKANENSVIKPKSKDQEAIEEVVGQLDTAIGTSKDGRVGGYGGTSMDYDEDYEQTHFSEKAEKGSFAMEGFMYDSDSSREEERAKGQKDEYSSTMPLELPFPPQPLPLGIGSTFRPLAYESDLPSPDLAPSEQLVGNMNQHLPEPSLSPFVNPREEDKLSWEKDSWFLVQLPTRLPPLQPRAPDGPMPTFSAEDPIDDVNVEDPNQQPSISEVVTPPLTAKSHDNVLTSAAPGRIGKIIVYKSGKTVLKMESPDGFNSVVLNVNEGLTCSFLQQVVVIDPDDAKFVTLGSVSKSIVITPDLESALVAE